MRDRDLVRLYWPVELRPAFDALFAIDDALADVVATSTEPALGAIRLAWWREALQRLDAAPPPAEPRLQAAASELLGRGIFGADVAALEDGWAALLDQEADGDRLADRGTQLFSIGRRLLGAADPKLDEAGQLFAFADLARRGLMSFPQEIDVKSLKGHRFSRQLRPLTALARLAARDWRQRPSIEPEATPARAAALLSHRLFGVVA